MTVNKFSCSNSHEFYFSLGLPVELTAFTELIDKVTCPICQCKEINIHAGEMNIEGEATHFRIGDYAIKYGTDTVLHITNDNEKQIANANGDFRKATENEVRQHHQEVTE